LFLLTLDWGNNIINKKTITKWLLDQSLVHPREVFASAIEDRAKSIILVHNHPGWNSNPSSEDLRTTIRLKEVSELVWIKLLDHIIISKNWHYSFNKNNVL
jgi:DNA repair protein RadC